MKTKRKAAAQGQAANQNRQRNYSTIKPDTKLHGILSALVSGKSLNRFEASREHFDTCLNSTVSEIQNRLGIQVHRVTEKVPCVNGTKEVDVCRYSLLPDQIKKAEKLLGVAA